MVNLALGVAASGSLAERGFDLGEFPALGDAPVVAPKVATPAWNFLDQSLQFFPPVKKDGQVRVSPPPEVLNSGVQQWCNGLIGNILGKSSALAMFQRTANRLWGREGSVEIWFLAPSVYIINFPSQRVRDWVLESGP
ncbi:hypothetical protein V6N13_005365 [Hibiscus sabdariffa]